MNQSSFSIGELWIWNLAGRHILNKVSFNVIFGHAINTASLNNFVARLWVMVGYLVLPCRGGKTGIKRTPKNGHQTPHRRFTMWNNNSSCFPYCFCSLEGGRGGAQGEISYSRALAIPELMPFFNLILKMGANRKIIIVECQKHEPFNLQFWKLWVQNQTEKNFPLHIFQN